MRLINYQIFDSTVSTSLTVNKYTIIYNIIGIKILNDTNNNKKNKNRGITCSLSEVVRPHSLKNINFYDIISSQRTVHFTIFFCCLLQQHDYI